MELPEQQFFLQSPQAMVITDSDSNIIRVNPAFERITGYSFAEVVGEKAQILAAEALNMQVYEVLWPALRSNGSWQGELWQQHKDGTVYPVWLSICCLWDEGRLMGYAAQFFDISPLKTAITLQAEPVHYDELTQLPSWDRFRDVMDARLQRAAEIKEQMAVLLVDLDRFKWINDTLGREVGDGLLQEVARRLGSVAPMPNSLARLNSDEFVMLVPCMDGVETATRIAQQVVEQLGHGIMVDHREIFISGSVGIAMTPEHGNRARDLVKKADVAMYAAKQGGRNTFRTYSPVLELSKGPQILHEEDLVMALDAGQLKMCFLPVYSLHNHQVVAVHAAPIWQHEELGQVPFSGFSSLLQGAGSVRKYEAWLAQELQSFNLIWERYPGLRFISLRLEKQQLKAEDDAQRWLALLQKYQMTGAILLDIDLETAQEKEGLLFDVLTSDALLSLSGFSRKLPDLEQLKDIHPDIIRLDADLVTNMSGDTVRQKQIRSVLHMADRLGIEVLADGVATAGQRGELMGQGCMLMQGRYFGLPLSLEQLLAHLAVEH